MTRETLRCFPCIISGDRIRSVLNIYEQGIQFNHNKLHITINFMVVSCLRTCRPPPPQKWWPQKGVMKGAKFAELKGKINKKILRFYFSSYHWKLEWFFHKNVAKITITRKIKIGKIWNLVFLSIQPIADLSSEFENFQK